MVYFDMVYYCLKLSSTALVIFKTVTKMLQWSV